MSESVTDKELEEALVEDMPDNLRDLISRLAEERDDLIEERDDAKAELIERDDDHAHKTRLLEDALIVVSRWMHEVLYLGRPLRDPRPIIRQVDEALS